MSLKAPELGAHVIKESIKKRNINFNDINELIFGNVLYKQMLDKIPSNISCTTINKVCLSGMKSIQFGLLFIIN